MAVKSFIGLAPELVFKLRLLLPFQFTVNSLKTVMYQCLLHLIQYSDVSVLVTFDTLQWCLSVSSIWYNTVMSQCLLHLLQYSDVSVSVRFDTLQWCLSVSSIWYNTVMSQCLLHFLQYSDVSVFVTFVTMQWCLIILNWCL